MAYGGGTWVTMNKVMPGAYINFISAAKATAELSERGIAAAPFVLNWGPENTVFEVTAEDFQKKCTTIFGYAYEAPEMLALREIFCHATKVYCYRLGSGAKAASNTYGTAKYPGTRGNAVSVVIAKSVDNEALYEVSTYVDGTRFDSQNVEKAADLADNAFVVFDKTATLAETAGTPLSGGANAAEITGESHQAFLDKIESYSYNALCCPVADTTTVALYENFNARVRDSLGAKSQLIAWQSDADYEGVIGAWNTVTHPDIPGVDAHMIVYWLTGAHAGTAVNRSMTNVLYDGELTVNVDHTQTELEAAINAGKFMFHNANGEVRVLADINTLVTLTKEKGEVFQSNQTIRVCDQIANDVAVLFNTSYIGVVANDDSGRASLWNDIIKIFQALERIRAIENFDPDMVSVDVGNSKGAVVLTTKGLRIINAMIQLYMSTIIQ